ncbi:MULTISPECIES: pyridoxamine 5'-phosphate oxidase family protein [unclassified Acinetobacter]|uniref:pyridoxamine 5'-phosphate oxidase family protein n=1 Tax=unclassified Acinetobacter TaxID=196816 RepID=UPI0019092173|nr:MULTISPECIES: pyridoxamine 5'-phosphate oxidase family protein [unclassified Acinetobacter]MBK0064114.1 pyridoxamine 5'-phosphate oxidase family protein [Acinetobacter sp. S55]MBK0067377.1 pyridoxamine 5'-phosphate oxidase family protein [Acinetobacter sp. S54]
MTTDYQTINDLIKNERTVIVTFTNAEGHLHAVPMTTQNREFNGEIWFIGSKRSELCQNLETHPQVNLAYTTSSHQYISIHGTGTLVNDQTILDELWSPAYDAFFENGKDDPDIQLVRIDAHGAQYWESAGAIATLYKLTKAAISGEKQQLGTSETLSL